MNPWRRSPNQPPKPDDSISLEDIEWRIGASEVRPHEEGDLEDAEARPVWIGEEEAAGAAAASAAAGAAPPEATAEPKVAPKPRTKVAGRRTLEQAHPAPVRARRRAAPVGPHAHPVVGAAPRRLTLWRDVSALLFGAVAIVLIAQLALGNRGETAIGTSSPGASAEGTDVAVIQTDAPAPTSEFTIGPVINPSLIPVIEATPTPVPIITLPPTPVPTPRITPRPTTKPVVTPKPTVKPSAAPTPVVTPAPTPPPAATVNFTCSAPVGLSVTCHDASLNIIAGSEVWDFLRSPGSSGSGSTSGATATWTFGATGDYDVYLTVTGLDGKPATDHLTVSV